MATAVDEQEGRQRRVGRCPPIGARRASIVWLGGVIAAAVVVRILFVQHAPVLATGDSETYLGPALAFERGAALDLSMKRTPGYPLVAAGALWLLGEDLRALAAVQHALGLLSVVLVFVIGSRLMSR